MTRAAVKLLIVLLLLAGVGPAWSRIEENHRREDGIREGESRPGSLTELWRLRTLQQDRGEAEAASESLEMLRERRRLNGVSSAPDLAHAFLHEGYRHLEINRYSDATESFRLATEFDATMPAAWMGLARTEWAAGAGISQALPTLAHAALAGWQNLTLRKWGAMTLYWLITITLILAAAVVTTVLFLRSLPLIHHELHENLKRRIPSRTAAIIAVMVPFLPLALPMGAAWTPLLWLVLSVPFWGRRERAVALTLTMAAGSAALLAPWGASRTALVADPRLVQVAHAAAGGVSADSARTLDNLVRLSPNDAVLHLLHADQARGQGLEATAAAGYRRATELDPALGAAANNAGALYFSLGRFATASGHFRRAIEAEPDNMAAYYNLYLAQERRFDFAAAEKTLMEARGRNLDAMTALLSQRGSDDERLDVVEARVPVATALAHARRALNLDQSATSLSASAGGGTAAVILPLLAWVVAVWRLRSRNLPQRCAACGAIACRQCTLHMEDRERCAPCSHLAGRTTSLPRNVRERKRLEAATWRRSSARRCRIAAALLPGGGQLWGGRPVLGVLLLAIACCGAASLLLSRVLPGVGSLPAVPEAVAAGVIGPFLLMAPWAAGWLYAFQGRRSAHGGGR